MLDEVGETIPAALREKYRLLSDQVLIEKMHHPKNGNEAKIARRSAIFREFFFSSAISAALSQRDEDVPGVAKKYDLAAVKELIQTIPFELSNDQKR